MSNMSYCRFENTLQDLRDCNAALNELFAGEHGALSDSELEAAKRLAAECAETLRIITENSDEGGLIVEQSIFSGEPEGLHCLIDAAQKECVENAEDEDDCYSGEE